MLKATAMRHFAMGVALALMAATPSLADPRAGKVAFSMACGACHAIGGKGGQSAPDLKGVKGRRAGADPDFAYSSAMRSSGLVWDAAKLKAFIAKPGAVVPRTRMPAPGVSDKKAADIVDYLMSVR